MEFSDDRIVLTREGYDEIQRELNEIMTVKRPAVIDRIREARQLGDLSENFDYQDAKHVQALLEARLKELKTIIGHSVVVDCNDNNGCIGVGSKVIVKDISDGFEDEYTIVGPTESSPAEGRISLESLVGSALMGHKEGDEVAVRAPAGVIKYVVVSVL
ncbi:MAG: transcription elongation factor GreA [Armatimonadota bacterium]